MRYGVSNFIKIAKEYVEPDTTTLEGIERKLISWYCFTYGTTPNDVRLQEMTLEELLILFQMHRIKNNPAEVENELGANTYEDWLKKEMGEDYKDDEQMVAEIEEEEKKYQEKIAKKFPDKVTTNFNQFKE